jgi:large subunit ribosomal protein L9
MAMKLILTQDVTGLGDAGDVVEVKDGYGRNYLLPRGFAIAWTRGGEKQVTQIRRARSARTVRDLDHAREIKQALEALAVTVPAKAGDGGRLFGSVTTTDIAAAVKAAGGPSLDKRAIVVASPIKTVGSHRATVEVHPDVTATVTVEVVAG